MIQFKFRLTWPLLVFIVLAAPVVILALLARGPKAKPAAQPTNPQQPHPGRAAHPRYRRFVEADRGAKHHIHPATMIINADGSATSGADREGQISFADALKSGRYSAEELSEIGNREAMDAARTVYEAMDSTPYQNAREKLNAWRIAHVRTND